MKVRMLVSDRPSDPDAVSRSQIGVVVVLGSENPFHVTLSRLALFLKAADVTAWVNGKIPLRQSVTFPSRSGVTLRCHAWLSRS